MKLHIHRVILWPQRPGLLPRVISFSDEKVNVITGQSQTGKSSLISIVDYALGSGKCAIPVGKIRDLTAWFGVMLKGNNGYLTLARRTPGQDEQSGDMFVLEAATDTIPNEISKNANVEDVKAQLDKMAQLPSLAIDPSSPSGFDGRPSFRDMAAFNFQPQHIVANPYTLFFKADTEEHRRKLVSVFPFVLGAIDATHLMKRRQLQELEQQLQHLESEREVRERAVSGVFEDLKAKYYLAAELGIVRTASPSISSWTLQDLAVALVQAIGETRKTGLALPSDGATNSAVRQLLLLRMQEETLSSNLGQARRKLINLVWVESQASTYGSELRRELHRLDGLGWFSNAVKGPSECPLCRSTTDEAMQELARMHDLADETLHLSARLESAPASLGGDIAKLQTEIREMEASMRQLRRQAVVLEIESEKVAAVRQTTAEVFRLVGQIEQSLAAWTEVQAKGDMAKRLETLKKECEALRKELNPQMIRERQKSALWKVSMAIAEYAKILKLERRDDVAGISVTDLAIRIESKSSRRDYLWEIGSGANHMGYHLAALLSLHELFLSQSSSPVPSFLMIDQPSQVYFPERWPGDPRGDKKKDELGRQVNIEDEDIQGVHRIFNALATAIDRTGKKLQIIVTDHAGAITWTGLDVNLVAEWRTGKGDFLIPEEWMKAA